MKVIKDLVKKCFNVFGLQISRIPKQAIQDKNKIEKIYTSNIYFNDGKPVLEQNSKEIYDQFYSDQSVLNNYFDGSRLGFYEKIATFFYERKINLNEKKVADFGCGTGHLLAYLKKYFISGKYVGNDFSGKGIEYAKNNFPDFEFYVYNIYTANQNKYDVIICTEVLEHLEFPEIALKNILSSLEPKGMALITVPNGRIDSIEEHINFWSPESWKIFIQKNTNMLLFETGTLSKGTTNYTMIYNE